MRIQHSVIFTIQQRVKSVAKKTPILLFGVVFIVASVVVWQNIITSPTTSYAATPSDNCFAFSAGAITDYYNNENNNAANPACPRAVDIPSTIGGVAVTSFGNYALYDNQLTSVAIPDSVTSIGSNAFSSNELTSVVIPSGVTSIGNYAFYNNQVASVAIPSSVATIGNYAFYDNQLTAVTILGTPSTIGSDVLGGNPIESITHASIVYSASDPISAQCLTQVGGAITKYRYLDLALLVGSGIGCLSRTVDIPQSIAGVTITAIGNSAFNGSQLTSVTIPNSVTSIGSNAFAGNRLTSVVIPDGVTSISTYAFYGNLLTTVTIPNSVTSIGTYAFYGNQLTAVTILGTPSTIGDGVLGNNPIESVAHAGTVYSADDSLPTQCFMRTDGTITDYYYLDLALLVGSGVACLSRAVDVPQSIASVEITAIGSSAFSRKQLTSVTIPNSVTSIGGSAFSYNQLTAVTIPSSVTSINNAAFSQNQLTAVTIPSSVTSIGSYAFLGNQLTSLTLGCGVTSLVNGVFGANQLTDVTIPDCITSIDPMTFFGQNPWGGAIEVGTDPAHYWYSSDQNVLQLVYDNIWYVRLHTEDSSNPNNLEDSVTSEDWYTGDLNGDGDGADSIGGHLVNPASVTARYVNGLGTSLAADDNSTGRLGNGTNLTGYLIKDTQIPEIDDISSLTEAERTALDLAFAPYYRQGQNITLNAPTISGYTLQQPSSPYTTRLLNAANLVTFTYATSTTPTQPPVTPPFTAAPVATTADNTTSAIALPDELLTSIDFTTKIGSDTVPSDLKPIMASSRLSVDDTASCRHISSARLLPATGFTSPDANQTTIGGLAFVLNCQATGGDANITFTLGGTISDLTKTSVYKLDKHGASTDITEKIMLSNQSPDGHTTISYALTDGQSLDDDGLANGSISDPIYITTLAATDSVNNTNGTTSAATSATDSGIAMKYIAMIIGGAVLVIFIVIGLIVAVRRRRTIG